MTKTESRDAALEALKSACESNGVDPQELSAALAGVAEAVAIDEHLRVKPDARDAMQLDEMADRFRKLRDLLDEAADRCHAEALDLTFQR